MSMTVSAGPSDDEGECTEREQELSCYKCNQAGHKMKNCPDNTRGRGLVECCNECYNNYQYVAKDCKVKKPPVVGVAHAAVAVPIDPSNVKDGKLLLRGGDAVDIVSSSCAHGIGHTNLPIADGCFG